jgi:hypothetical protein
MHRGDFSRGTLIGGPFWMSSKGGGVKLWIDPPRGNVKLFLYPLKNKFGSVV